MTLVPLSDYQYVATRRLEMGDATYLAGDKVDVSSLPDEVLSRRLQWGWLQMIGREGRVEGVGDFVHLHRAVLGGSVDFGLGWRADDVIASSGDSLVLDDGMVRVAADGIYSARLDATSTAGGTINVGDNLTATLAVRDPGRGGDNSVAEVRSDTEFVPADGAASVVCSFAESITTGMLIQADVLGFIDARFVVQRVA